MCDQRMPCDEEADPEVIFLQTEKGQGTQRRRGPAEALTSPFQPVQLEKEFLLF